MSTNFNEFRLRVNTSAPVEKVYAAWATQEGLESWFLSRADIMNGSAARQGDEPAQKGDAYEFRWHGHPDGMSHKGKIVAADGKSQFTFTFSQDYPVSISLYREHDETIVDLVETFDPADEGSTKHFVSNMKGWIFFLANLKSVMEGGIDLRNRKVELKNVITS